MIEDMDAMDRLADQYIDRRDFFNAIGLYDQLIKQEPDNPRFYALRGYCRYHEGSYRLALEDFSTAIPMKPDVPTILYYRAKTYEHLDQPDKAL